MVVQPILAGLRNVLICTDGSEYSEGAIREGIRLAKQSGAAVTVLSVIDFNPEFDALAPDLLEKMEKEAQQHLRTVKERAEKEGVNCRSFVLRSQTPYVEIAREAANLGCGLIVMGRRGKTGLKRLMMGSVAKRVIGHAPCSVLVVPRASRLDFRKILCATDGSACSEAAVAEAVAVAGRWNSELLFVSVVHAEAASPLDIVQSQMRRGLIAESELAVAESSIKKAKDSAKKAGLQTDGSILAGRPFEAIVNAAKEKSADLIIMGSHGRTGVDRLLMGSVTERVIGVSECAVLVLKERMQ